MAKSSTTPKLTTVAIAYDFDGTLARGNIQENSYIPEQLKMSKEDFWKEVSALAKKDEMDSILAYMFLLIEKAKKIDASYGKSTFIKHGKNVKYFEGVERYFSLINRYAKSKGIELKHYVISSGTKEMISGTTIAKRFHKIFASTFKYDANGVPVWPAVAINYTSKTQFLFRVNKGLFDISDSTTINSYMPDENRPVPFPNMIYIGDGLTDVPAMKLVKTLGGHSIGVYDETNEEARNEVEKLLVQDRVNYVAPANYKANSAIMNILKGIINEISARYSIKKYGKQI